MCHCVVRAFDEGQLRIHGCVKEMGFRFGINFEGRLLGEFGEKVIVFARDIERSEKSESVLTDVIIVNLVVNPGDLPRVNVADFEIRV